MDLEQVYESAAKWLVATGEGLSSRERLEFDNWLSRDPLHRVAFIRLQTLADSLNRLADLRPSNGDVDADLLLRIRSHSPESEAIHVEELRFAVRTGATGGKRLAPHRRWTPKSAIAASIVCITMLLTPPHMSDVGRSWDHYTTPAGASQNITLSDGTLVRLSENSEIRIGRAAGGRTEVVLVRGQAVFQVTRKAAEFVVWAGETMVRTMGAEFSIKRVDDREEVAVDVVDGRVWVAKSKVPIIDPIIRAVVSGDEVRVDQGNASWVEHLAQQSISKRLKWGAGLVSFKGEPLVEVVQELNRYNRRQLIVADESIAKIKIGGAFQTNDPDALVAFLCRWHGISAFETGGANPVILLRTAADKADGDLCRHL